MKYFSLLLALVACLAPDIGLSGLIGQPAPPLAIKEWVKGGPVEIKPGTNIFLVEIWSTKGAASRAAITNLNHLQNRFKTNGLVVVGISDEDASVIKDFVQHNGTNIEYAIAADDHRRTSLGYMGPAGQFAVPAAFVVGTNGDLLWDGHAFHGLGQALEQIIAGTYDLERTKKRETAAHQMEQYLSMARRGDSRARIAGMVLLANRTNDVDLLCDMAFAITTAPKMTKRDFPLAGRALDEAERLAPTNSAHVMINRSVWLFERGKLDQGLLLATQALASARSPEERSSVQALLDTMNARLAVVKLVQSRTNQLNDVRAPSPVSGADTNNSGSPSKTPAPKS